MEEDVDNYYLNLVLDYTVIEVDRTDAIKQIEGEADFLDRLLSLKEDGESGEKEIGNIWNKDNLKRRKDGLNEVLVALKGDANALPYHPADHPIDSTDSINSNDSIDSNGLKNNKDSQLGKPWVGRSRQGDPQKIEMSIFKLPYHPSNDLISFRHHSAPLMDTLSKCADLPSLPTRLPMLCRPRPRTDFREGGYLSYSEPLVTNRGRQSRHGDLILELAKLPAVYNIVTQISNVPWTVNTDVLQVVEAIVARHEKKELSCFKEYGVHSSTEMTPEGATSLESRIFVSLFKTQFGAAKILRDQHFYTPYQLDFRGRWYSIPSLNHAGPDVPRSLLKYAEGKRLGSRGLMWLKRHTGSTFGSDKKPFNEREEFVDNNLDFLKKLVDDPLNKENIEYLLKLDKPFQAIAVANEMVRAMEYHDPEDYISSLPIHQDGSCNGYQHYAAISRSAKGGNAVNLVPQDRPQDMYTDVLKIVVKMIEEEKKPEKKKLADLCLERREIYLTRKTVKSTVMTIPYGVSVGTSCRQVEDAFRKAVKSNEGQQYIDQAHWSGLSRYIAEKVHEAVKEKVFTEAEHVKDWLVQVAEVTTDNGIDIAWLSPILNFTAIQQYRKQEGALSNMWGVKVYNAIERGLLDRQKHIQAFPPNFIHSLDATHMMLTAERCIGTGITFSSVHESFWTHGASSDQLADLLRETFVQLYSHDILEDLYKLTQARINPTPTNLKKPPARGSLDVSEVLKSKYFFS
eukprot:GHVN01019578.1.p1 GENE.GHVN01019578.1~~GHVN01019578.1.p1  ORF type:complete len:757 (+),score=119.66 GHVN01019578.1:53-2272(+)